MTDDLLFDKLLIKLNYEKPKRFRRTRGEEITSMTPLSFDYPISVLILYSENEEQTVLMARQLAEALQEEGHKVRMFLITEDNWRQSIHQPGEVTFNLVEDDGWRLWGNCFRLFERVGRAQYGIDHKSFIYSLSKARVKRRLKKYGLATPAYRVIKYKKYPVIRGLEYPVIIKPSGEHASEGISQDSVVIDEKELRERVDYLFKKFKGDVLVEEFIDGREMHVTVIGNGKHVVVMPFCEIMFKGEYADNWNIFTYDAKWRQSSWEYWDSPIVCPTSLPKDVDKRIDDLVKSAFTVLGCRDIARFDLRIDEKGRPYIIDMNLLPDLSFDSETECWRSVQSLGWSYAQFIETLLAITYKRSYGRMPDRLRERQLLLQTGV